MNEPQSIADDIAGRLERIKDAMNEPIAVPEPGSQNQQRDNTAGAHQQQHREPDDTAEVQQHQQRGDVADAQQSQQRHQEGDGPVDAHQQPQQRHQEGDGPVDVHQQPQQRHQERDGPADAHQTQEHRQRDDVGDAQPSQPGQQRPRDERHKRLARKVEDIAKYNAPKLPAPAIVATTSGRRLADEEGRGLAAGSSPLEDPLDPEGQLIANDIRRGPRRLPRFLRPEETWLEGAIDFQISSNEHVRVTKTVGQRGDGFNCLFTCLGALAKAAGRGPPHDGPGMRQLALLKASEAAGRRRMIDDFHDLVGPPPESKVIKSKEQLYDEWLEGLRGKAFGDGQSVKALRPHLDFPVGMVVRDISRLSSPPQVLAWPVEEDELDFEAGRMKGPIGMVELVGNHFEMLAEKDGREDGRDEGNSRAPSEVPGDGGPQ